jgi:hypothetical protein
MLIRAFRHRKTLDRSVLDCTYHDNMVFVHPHAATVSFVAVHPAVVGRGTQCVPSSALDPILRQTVLRAGLRFCNTSDRQEGERAQHETANAFHF